MSARRWWTYLQERFPLPAHGPVVLAVSASAVCFSALLRGVPRWPPGGAFACAFIGCLAFFFQLRVADEFKDAQDDARWRPTRPVPRGLVTLRELAAAGALAAALQAALSLLVTPALLAPLALVWLYLGLMTREFFAPAWLRARPAAYLLSHMAILPLIMLYATACEWLPAGAGPHPGILWFLALSYANGVVFEIGRKIRAPEDEQEGVETYSALWGRPAAVGVWLGAMGAAGLLAVLGMLAARQESFVPPLAAVLGAVLAGAAAFGAAFLRAPAPRRGRVFEALSGLWLIASYLGLSVVPFALLHR